MNKISKVALGLSLIDTDMLGHNCIPDLCINSEEPSEILIILDHQHFDYPCENEVFEDFKNREEKLKEILKLHIKKLEKLGFKWFGMDSATDDLFMCGFAINLLEISGDR